MSTFVQSWICATAAFVIAAPLSGCATLARGTTETFVVEASPADARVTTSLGAACKASPCAFTGVSRKASFTVRIERDGYLTKTVAVRHRTSGGGVSGAVGSAILPIPYVGSLATLFDIRSGATQSLSPNPLRVTLEPEPRVSAAEPGATPPAGRF